MKLPDFLRFEPFNGLRDKMNIPREDDGSLIESSPQEDSPPPPPAAPLALPAPKGRASSSSNPAIASIFSTPNPTRGPTKTSRSDCRAPDRWGGYSKWPLPLSVAQHSLTVLALREAEGPLTAREALRELLHDATEALFGGFDPDGSIASASWPRLRASGSPPPGCRRPALPAPAWTEESYAQHKHADRLAAASEAFHIVGWTREEMRSSLEIGLEPIDDDPLFPPDGMRSLGAMAADDRPGHVLQTSRAASRQSGA